MKDDFAESMVLLAIFCVVALSAFIAMHHYGWMR